MLKLHFNLVVLLALIVSSIALSNSVMAIADDALILDAELQDNNSMTWPMLPGENLNDLARLFYPKNQSMQRQFVAKTLRLSSNMQADLNATKRFETPTLLVIPTLKSLSYHKNRAKEGRKKPRKKKLQLSYDIGQSIEQVPAKLIQDYEWLVSKNAFLKEELAQLNKKIVFLQTKLNDLKLIFDKTLNLPNSGSQTAQAQTISADVASNHQPTSNLPVNNLPARKVFKNLNDVKYNQKKSDAAEALSAETSITMPQAISLPFVNGNKNIIIIVMAVLALLTISSVLLKKYRQRMFTKFTDAIPQMDDTLLDFGGHWKDEGQALDQQTIQEIKQEIQNTEAKTIQFTAEPQKAYSNADATLVEAKLLMSIHRSQDAIDHLKLTIDSSPKASINHWLYLLEIFRKLNLKDEFEQYAEGLKANFNVTTQAWDDSIAPSTLPQHLEEFPTIMEKLYTIWPSDQAQTYLRSLITDNRDGERAGFGKAVLSEILLLIALLDTRKDFN